MRKMKLMMMAFALMLTAGATAQSTNETQRADGTSKKSMRPQRMKRVTQEQMTKKMVSELKLDEKQTKSGVHLILRGNCPAPKVNCLLTSIPAYPLTSLNA